MRLTLTLIMAVAFSSADGQTFSVRAGLNVATQAWRFNNKTLKPKSAVGPHLNIAVTNSLTRKIATQLEVGYTRIGHGGYEQASPVQDIPEDHEDFALAALMFKYHVSEGVNFHIGPQLGWFVGDRQNLGQTDFSAAAGIEAYPNKYLGFGARYCYGISDLNPDQLASQKSRFFQISVIIRFKSEQLDELHY